MLYRISREINVSSDWFGCVLVISFYFAKVFSESAIGCLINVLSVFLSVEICKNITWPLLDFFGAMCSCSWTEMDPGLVRR